MWRRYNNGNITYGKPEEDVPNAENWFDNSGGDGNIMKWFDAKMATPVTGRQVRLLTIMHTLYD